LAPQLYWREGGPQSFSSLLRWWRSPSVNPKNIPIIPGIAVDRMKSHGWASSEIQRQLKLEKTISPRPGGGFLLWNIGSLSKNTKDIVSVVRTE
jgi:hypothetical protein